MWLELSKIHIDTFVFWWLENVGWKVQVVKIIFYTLDIFSSFVGWLENVFVVKIVFWTFDSFVFTLEEKVTLLKFVCLHAWIFFYRLEFFTRLNIEDCLNIAEDWLRCFAPWLGCPPLRPASLESWNRIWFLLGTKENTRIGKTISCRKER